MCLCTLVQEFLLGTYLEVTFLGQIYDTTAECFLKCSRSDGVNQFTLPHSTQVQLSPQWAQRIRLVLCTCLSVCQSRRYKTVYCCRLNLHLPESKRVEHLFMAVSHLCWTEVNSVPSAPKIHVHSKKKKIIKNK